MKRYSMGFFKAPAMFEQPEGDYVRWADVKTALDGCVFLAAFGDKKEITGLFDTAEQAHAFVKWCQQFVQMDQPVTLGGGLPGDPNGTGATTCGTCNGTGKVGELVGEWPDSEHRSKPCPDCASGVTEARHHTFCDHTPPNSGKDGR